LFSAWSRLSRRIFTRLLEWKDPRDCLTDVFLAAAEIHAESHPAAVLMEKVGGVHY
jgi:hypothetical protein